MIPFLRWAGGKRWFIANHGDWLVYEPNRYLEPFLGSGAVFFHLKPKVAILSDLNSDLIETYIAIRDTPEKVWELLKKHQKNHCKKYYYEVRKQNPYSLPYKAARLIYLNRTCFNGLYRVNKNGQFNVPIGTKSSVIFENDNFESISNFLKSTFLFCQDFSKTISMAKLGDMLYIDPPYTVKHNNNNFLKYNEHIFSWDDQKRLAETLTSAAKRGAHVLISNAAHTCIKELYSDKIWECLSVNRFSQIASNANYRKKTTEFIISNYLNKKGEQVPPRN